MWVKVFLFISTLLFLFDLHYEDLALVHHFTSFSCICPCDLQCSHYASSAAPPVVNSGFKALHCSTPICCALPQMYSIHSFMLFSAL